MDIKTLQKYPDIIHKKYPENIQNIHKISRYYPWIHGCVSMDTRFPGSVYPWIISGYKLDTKWIHTGYNLDKYPWIFPRYFCDTFWIQSGYKLDTYWIHSG